MCELVCWGEGVTPHHGAEEVSSAAQKCSEGGQSHLFCLGCVRKASRERNRQVEKGEGGPSREGGHPGTPLEMGPGLRVALCPREGSSGVLTPLIQNLRLWISRRGQGQVSRGRKVFKGGAWCQQDFPCKPGGQSGFREPLEARGLSNSPRLPTNS